MKTYIYKRGFNNFETCKISNQVILSRKEMLKDKIFIA